MRNILQQGPYRQSAGIDLWLPVKGALVSVLVKSAPVLAVVAEACLIGRGFGPLLLGMALITEYAKRKLDTPPNVKTWQMWLAGIVFVGLWFFDAWPIPASVLSYTLRQSVAPDTAGRWLVMWRRGTATAWQPMGAWLTWRIALIVLMPLTLVEPYLALNWRTLVEIVAPTFANSITAPKPATAKTPVEKPLIRETSAPLTDGQNPELF